MKPSWGNRYPPIPKPAPLPINKAVPSTPCKAGPLGNCNGDSQSLKQSAATPLSLAEGKPTAKPAKPAGSKAADAKKAADAAAKNNMVPRWGVRFPKPAAQQPKAKPVNKAVPSTPCKAGALGPCNGDSQSLLANSSSSGQFKNVSVKF